MKNRAKNADALLLTGGDWVPHDLRRTGATLMQSIKVAPAIIERVLNHVEPSKLIRTYQTYDYAEEKRVAWNRLGNKLTELLPQTAQRAYIVAVSGTYPLGGVKFKSSGWFKL